MSVPYAQFPELYLPGGNPDSEYRIVPRERLAERETFWRNHQTWLKAAGYILRPRYQPNWVASWLTDLNKGHSSEDYKKPMEGVLLDAIRVRDGAQVMLKRIRVQRDPAEMAIAAFFSTDPLASNPNNHCIPVYDILELPDDSNDAILVMPFLLHYDESPFICIAEIVDFIQQILEGLLFMHQKNVAHCDVKMDNVMSDAVRLYRVPPHPLAIYFNFSNTGPSKLVSNRMQKNVKHYLVDFGLSSLQPPETSRLVHPGFGGNRSVPEFQNYSTKPCDPFAVDVYCMGDFMRKRFRQEREGFWATFDGLDFMDDLIADMVQEDPKKRPTMDEVAKRFSEIISRLSSKKLMSRASTMDETRSQRIIRNARYWILRHP